MSRTTPRHRPARRFYADADVREYLMTSIVCLVTMDTLLRDGMGFAEAGFTPEEVDRVGGQLERPLVYLAELHGLDYRALCVTVKRRLEAMEVARGSGAAE